MTDGHRRREEDDGRRMGVGGTLAPLESRDRRRGEILELGGGRRWDVDLGSSHDGGWSRSRHHPLIGPIEGANPTSSPLVRTAWEDEKRSPELQKRPAHSPMM